MDYSQKGSVFIPGLNANGPVYNGMGGLPAISSPIKYGMIGLLLYLGYTKKIPMIAASAGAFAVLRLLPTAPAPITTDLTAQLNAQPITPDTFTPIPDYVGIQNS